MPTFMILLYFSTYITILKIISLWFSMCFKDINFRLQKCSATLILISFSTYMTILIMISLLIQPWPHQLILYASLMFLWFSLNFNFIYLYHQSLHHSIPWPIPCTRCFKQNNFWLQKCPPPMTPHSAVFLLSLIYW